TARIWLIAGLAHVTLLAVAGFALPMVVRSLHGWAARRGGAGPLEIASWTHGFSQPWLLMARLTSLLTLIPLAAFLEWTTLPACAGAMLWLALFWLALSWQMQRARWFAMFQAGVTVALLFVLIAWQHARPGVAERIIDVFRFPTIQVLLLGVAGLG